MICGSPYHLPITTPITSLGKPSNGREVGKEVGREIVLTYHVTELLVNVDDEGAFLESMCACVCPITQFNCTL